MDFENWKVIKKEFEQFLKFERGLSVNSIDAYLNDVSKISDLLRRQSFATK
jgi:Phage integrase, N-terminal SAM-like domain.